MCSSASVQVAQDRHGDDLFASLKPPVQLIGFQAQTIYYDCEIPAQLAVAHQVVIEGAAVQGIQLLQEIGDRGVLTIFCLDQA